MLPSAWRCETAASSDHRLTPLWSQETPTCQIWRDITWSSAPLLLGFWHCSSRSNVCCWSNPSCPSSPLSPSPGPLPLLWGSGPPSSYFSHYSVCIPLDPLRAHHHDFCYPLLSCWRTAANIQPPQIKLIIFLCSILLLCACPGKWHCLN